MSPAHFTFRHYLISVPSGPFSSVISFSQGDFQPAIANTFSMELCESRYVKLMPSLVSTLPLAEKVGMHTDIIEFQVGCITRYSLSHPVHQPFGIPTYIQCQRCGTMKGFKRLVVGDEGAPGGPTSYTSVCTCGDQVTTYRPAGLIVVKKSMISGNGTGWFWQQGVELEEFISRQMVLNRHAQSG